MTAWEGWGLLLRARRGNLLRPWPVVSQRDGHGVGLSITVCQVAIGSQVKLGWWPQYMMNRKDGLLLCFPVCLMRRRLLCYCWLGCWLRTCSSWRGGVCWFPVIKNHQCTSIASIAEQRVCGCSMSPVLHQDTNMGELSITNSACVEAKWGQRTIGIGLGHMHVFRRL